MPSNLVDILEAPHGDLEPAVGAGQPRQRCGRVEGGDLEASLGEGLGIAARAAAGIEDTWAPGVSCARNRWWIGAMSTPTVEPKNSAANWS
jgi:hypothetical protein